MEWVWGGFSDFIHENVGVLWFYCEISQSKKYMVGEESGIDCLGRKEPLGDTLIHPRFFIHSFVPPSG